MAYTDRNFKTKKALKQAFLDGETIGVYQPGPFGPEIKDGTTCLEGPHYPEPHRWYQEATVKAGKVVGLKGVKIPVCSDCGHNYGKHSSGCHVSREKGMDELNRVRSIMTVGALLAHMAGKGLP